jgi:hypothetical protein
LERIAKAYSNETDFMHEMYLWNLNNEDYCVGKYIRILIINKIDLTWTGADVELLGFLGSGYMIE